MKNNNSLHIEIISPEGIILKEEADEIILPTPDGEITILLHHIPLFTKLSEGEVIIRKSGKNISVAITGGFLEINKTSLTVISDYAIRADSIEIAQAQKAKERAEKILSEKVENTDFELIEKNLQRSILELKVAEKARKRYNN